jgi:iron complex transport system ATP-binding protein
VNAPTVAPMVGLRGLTVTFGKTTAIRDVGVEVAAGEWLGLIGPNGAGKTSLLKACVRLLRYEGDVLLSGRSAAGLSRRQLARLVAYVPQEPELPADMSVSDYVLLGRTPHIGFFGADGARDREICSGLLERLELEGRALRHLSTLSGGELQRVVIARALAQQAPVLLLDEPTSALDLGRRIDVLELVDELRKERDLTVVSAMHDLTLAGQFADRLLFLDHGRVVVQGAPGEVLRASSLTRHFGAEVEVLTTLDGELVVVPRRKRPGRSPHRLEEPVEVFVAPGAEDPGGS